MEPFSRDPTLTSRTINDSLQSLLKKSENVYNYSINYIFVRPNFEISGYDFNHANVKVFGNRNRPQNDIIIK